ncbi:hypothetical protein IQ260_30405 [Leptolyngbya cf. ectocarpi LEGE 11479]|uniref:Response regulatory domain-containing protein n=2 Tax=Leptolyngbya ectocarpi TaxID=1202 RepID=A0A929A0W8_LEPEC|nr:hypothetical protein [Leptolyngbya cf. ectocarpi LEGE 11479]
MGIITLFAILLYFLANREIKALQKMNPQVKIIATSGLPSDSNLDTTLSIDVNSFLIKPYTTESLLTTLNKVIIEYTT